MCPHFEKNAKKCGLCTQVEWSNLCSFWDIDFTFENYCEANEYTTVSGEKDDNTGYKNCAQYKSG